MPLPFCNSVMGFLYRWLVAMVELPLQNVKATAVLEIYRETHVTPFARKRDECKNKLKCRIEEPKGSTIDFYR